MPRGLPGCAVACVALLVGLAGALRPPAASRPRALRRHAAPRMDEVRRAAGDVPTTIGFGVATPEHVRAFAPLADGVVVGSALIREINKGRSPYERRTIARTFVGGLAAATLL